MNVPGASPTTPKKPKSELKTRLITGSILSALTLYLVWAGVYPFSCLVLFFAVIGQYEYQKFAVQKGFSPSRGLGIAMTLALLISSVFCTVSVVNEIMLFGMIVTFTVMLLRPHKRVSPFLDAALTTMGVVYVGWFFSYVIHLRKLPEGAALITLLLFGSAFTDMGGYFVGRKYGRRKLYPRVSPKKTVEGAIGGVFTAMAACCGVGLVCGLPYQHCLAAGVIIAISGSFGDLFESSLKRDVGVKDSGTAIPGHGGALDRFDSLAFAAPIFYLYAVHFML
ncbi:MAG: phosphatidate cytidylyltransferase [Candidatus Eremiobacteraeota bacterium]|nr:phosphatidate cytidylyltransferase [Candidatus Eremiobacteraeota bacterium]